MQTINTKVMNCVVQCRVSTLRQSQEGESLAGQEKTIRNFIGNKGWKIVPNNKVWSTAISGRKTDREDFEEILAFIKAHKGLVDYYVFRSIDRATRAGGEEYSRMKRELEKEGVQMLDTYGIIQPTRNTLEEYGMSYEWSKHSPSEMTENILATNAKQEVTNILTRMIGQEINLTRQGYRTRSATDGFINHKIHDSDGKKRPIQIANTERAKFYIAMYELRNQGLNDEEIVTKINAMGYRSRIRDRHSKTGKIIGKSGGVLLTVKQLQIAIQKTIYAGVMCEKWTEYKGLRAKYAGLVSIDTFNRANKGKVFIKENNDDSVEIIYGSPTSTAVRRNRNNPLFPYKFIRCSLCGKSFCGSSPRGKSGKKFPTYHCTKNHKYYGIKKAEFENTIETFTKNLRLRPELLNSLEITFLNKYREREKEVVEMSSSIHNNIADLKREQADRIDAIVATRSPVIREKLEADVEKLEAQIKEAQKESDRIQITEDDIKAFVREAKNVMEHPSEMLLKPVGTRRQEELFTLVFDEMPTYDEIVNGTPKMSFIFNLSSNISPVEGHLVWLSGFEPELRVPQTLVLTITL
jgi:site-specific DNA recombinase